MEPPANKPALNSQLLVDSPPPTHHCFRYQYSNRNSYEKLELTVTCRKQTIAYISGNNILDSVSVSGSNSPRLLTLWGIMRKFDAWGIAMLLRHINRLNGYSWKQSDAGNRDLSVPKQEVDSYVLPVVVQALHHARAYHLLSTYDRVWENGPFTINMKIGITYQQCINETEVLRECIEADLEKLWFAQIHPDKQKIAFDVPANWKKIWDMIPACKEDCHEAYYCYALERNTASVFHAMRVSEYGLRHVARKVRVTLTDKGKPHPIEYATWDKVIAGIKKKIEEARQLSQGPKKIARLQFWSSAAENCTYIRDIWRNEVSHTRRTYNDHEALGILERVKSFMQLLAEKK